MHFKQWLEGQTGGTGIEPSSQERGGIPLSILAASHGQSKGAFMTGGDKPPTSNKDAEDTEYRTVKGLKDKKQKRKMLDARKS